MEKPNRREDAAAKFMSGANPDLEPANDDVEHRLARLGFKRDGDGMMILDEERLFEGPEENAV